VFNGVAAISCMVHISGMAAERQAQQNKADVTNVTAPNDLHKYQLLPRSITVPGLCHSSLKLHVLICRMPQVSPAGQVLVKQCCQIHCTNLTAASHQYPSKQHPLRWLHSFDTVDAVIT
jgi:hypothetical protein